MMTTYSEVWSAQIKRATIVRISARGSVSVVMAS